MQSLSAYSFPLFYEAWLRSIKDVASSWDNKGDTRIGNDVWIGYEAIIMAVVTIGDGQSSLQERLSQKMLSRMRLLAEHLRK